MLANRENWRLLFLRIALNNVLGYRDINNPYGDESWDTIAKILVCVKHGFFFSNFPVFIFTPRTIRALAGRAAASEYFSTRCKFDLLRVGRRCVRSDDALEHYLQLRFWPRTRRLSFARASSKEKATISFLYAACQLIATVLF